MALTFEIMRFTEKTVGAYEQMLIERGYRRYVQGYKHADYVYWKGFERDEDRNKGYSVGLAFYDYSKYEKFNQEECISVGLHFMLGNDQGVARLDVDLTDDKTTIEEFEEFCAEFYEFYKTTELIKHPNED